MPRKAETYDNTIIEIWCVLHEPHNVEYLVAYALNGDSAVNKIQDAYEATTKDGTNKSYEIRFDNQALASYNGSWQTL